MTFLKASVVCEKFQIFTTIRSLLRPTVDNQLVAAVNYVISERVYVSAVRFSRRFTTPRADDGLAWVT